MRGKKGRYDKGLIRSKRCIRGLYCNMLIDSATWFTKRTKRRTGWSQWKMGSTMGIVNTGDRIIRQSYGLVPFLGTE